MGAKKWSHGPWATAVGLVHGIFVHAADGLLVADLRHGSDENKMADATLVAAAPEMYQALSELVDLVGREFEGRDEAPIASRRTLEVARAALAKARGER